jgi:sulfur relay protein TusB/DsrH
MNHNLHILTRNIIPSAVLSCDKNDGLLLIREAVYLLLKALPTGLANRTIFVLDDDLYARGMKNSILTTNIESINYSKFVKLLVQYQTNCTW